MILEGIVTTLDRGGRVNVSPMGPRVTPQMKALVLMPYKSARTYHNLKLHGEGVFHVVDDVELLARSAVGQVDVPVRRAHRVDGYYLPGACRFYEFRVLEIDDREERAFIRTDVIHSERLRDFFGFNRARHAVVEAAILATRCAFLPADEILRKFEEIESLVEKTGGDAEARAFTFLRKHVQDTYQSRTRGPLS